MAPVSPERGRFWRTTFAQVERELRAPDSALVHPLVLTETIRLLAGAALAVFPNPTMAADGHGEPGWVAPAVVRRAVDFIESRADRPMMVGEIAAAAGIGVRALQQAFVRHLGVSPMDYARRVRLARAHQDLIAADPTTEVTVRDIAARWGFARPDRFAAYYRERYGVPPSHSLRG